MSVKTRIFICIFALALLTAALSCAILADSRDGTLSVSVSSIEDGRFTATVSIRDNPGIAGMSIRLSFDKSKMQLSGFDASSGILPAAMSNALQEDTDISSLESVTYFFASEEDITSDGVLFKATFDVSPDSNGLSELKLSYSVGGITNSALDDLMPDIENCTVDLSSYKYPSGVISLDSEYLGLDSYLVTVGLYGNPGLAALNFSLDLTSSVVISSVDMNGIFDSVTSNITQPGAVLSELDRITYSYNTSSDKSSVGTLFTFKVRLLDGFGKISVSFDEGDVVNEALAPVALHRSALTFGELDIATVTFDENTDIPLRGEMPSDMTHVKNTYITLPFCPEREDKAYFLGWSDNKNDTTAKYAAGERFFLTEDKILYAIWTLRTYTVSYNANGGTNAPADQTKLHGKSITLSPSVPIRENYTFAGWSVLQNGSAVDFTAGGEYSENLSVTLYAVWKPNRYTVSFNANGGTNAPEAMPKYYGSEITLPASIPSKSGMGFAGWSDAPSGGDVKYLPEDRYTADGDAVLYAVWTSDKYDITFDANSGTGAPAAMSLAKGLSVKLPLETPQKTGFTFLGWSEDKNAAAPEFEAGGYCEKRSSVTLYAVWETARYTVKFDANGGNGEFGELSFTHGGSVKLHSGTPERAGWEFKGWAEHPKAVTPLYSAGGTFAQNRSVTLYAVWHACRYTVRYDANGGTNAPAPQEKLHGSDLRITVSKPTRTGFSFIGWADAPDAKESMYKAGGTYSSDSDIILYAVWSVKKYDVIYDSNNGIGTATPDKKIYDIPLFITHFMPRRDGFTFLGWAFSPDAALPEFKAGEPYTQNSDITLYAVWCEAQYTVSYDANGGSLAPAAQRKIHGVDTVLVNIKPERAGHIFIGWSLKADSQEIAYLPGAAYTEDSDITLYAVWCDSSLAALLELDIKYIGNGRLRADVILSSNPGISSVAFKLGFDKTMLRLISVTDDGNKRPQGILNGASLNFNISNIPADLSSVGFSWNKTSNSFGTGVILSLTFEVLCEVGDQAIFDIKLSRSTLNEDGQTVQTGVDTAYFTIPDFIPGDTNSDGTVDAKDSVLLAQYLAGWQVAPDQNAADCNADGKIDAKDSVLLAQYLAGWNVTLGG